MDIKAIREIFPVCKNLVYLDNAAVAPIHTYSKKAILEFTDYLLEYGASNYAIWFNKSEDIRAQMAKFIGARENEIAFIKNTSEGISFIANGINIQPGENVIIPDIEFPANVYPWINLKSKGVKVKTLETHYGAFSLEKLAELIDDKTRAISISSVQFLSGYRNDLKSISELCKEKSNKYSKKIYLCIDGIQSLGAQKIDVKELDIDFFSADGHKWFLTPEGAGIIYIKEDLLADITPTSIGWKNVKNPLDFTNINYELQDSARKLESGSLNILGILALGASCELFNKIGIENIENRILYLSNLARELLNKKNYEIISPEEAKHRSGILTFKTKENVDNMYKKFAENKIHLSKRGQFLRISPHFYNNEEDIEKFSNIL